jgi:spore coat polysaccharide biosynthesis predicted glycosyltransferase SpsG/RimJ/RimL family protein N-acetyltransferase
MSQFESTVKVFIRADGNAQIGYGHLMRAMAFASHAKTLTEVALIIRNPDFYSFHACQKYSIQCINISEIDIEIEAKYLSELIPSRSILFIDGYQFDESYLRIAGINGAYLICMDDHHDRFFPSGCVINVAELEHPDRIKRGVGSKLVYGLNYTLIRPEFEFLKLKRESTIFMCFGGGAETKPLIEKSTNALIASGCEFDNIQIVVNNSLKSELEQWFKTNYPLLKADILSQVEPEEMNRLMNTAMIGISSASTVSLECRTTGLPLIAGYFVENQKGIYHSLLINNEITGAGDLNTISERELSELIRTQFSTLKAISKFDSILKPEIIRENYLKLIQSCFIECDFKLRKAEEKDVLLYLNWANEPEVRMNAINNEPIREENHRKWFSSRLSSNSTLLLVGIWQNVEVGQVRFDEHEGHWEIDYSVAPMHQKRGFGEFLIRKGIEFLKIEKPSAERIVGLVKPQNTSSLSVFRKLHFTEAPQMELRDDIHLCSFSFSLFA